MSWFAVPSQCRPASSPALPPRSPHTTRRPHLAHPCWRAPDRMHGAGRPRGGPCRRAGRVEQVEPVARLRLRLEIELPLKRPDLIRCCQAHRPSPILGSFESAPEVRALPSPGVTQLQQYYDPVRHPREPSQDDVRRRDLRPRGSPPITRITLPACRAHYPDGPEQVRLSVASPLRSGLPRFSGGSASMTSLSRPAQASLALRPAGSLNRPRRPSLRGFDPDGCPSKPLVSYQVLPTTSWVDPSSTGEPRRRGALRNPG